MTDRVYRTDDPIPLEKGEEDHEVEAGEPEDREDDVTPIDRPPPVGRMGA